MGVRIEEEGERYSCAEKETEGKRERKRETRRETFAHVLRLRVEKVIYHMNSFNSNFSSAAQITSTTMTSSQSNFPFRIFKQQEVNFETESGQKVSRTRR